MNSLEGGLLQWSEKQQLWKQDLLRRIALGEHLTNKDIRIYASAAERLELENTSTWITKPELSEIHPFASLDDTHLTSTVQGGAPVRITKLTHIHGANDLVNEATLDFVPDGLTIIAGNNGSGKSGYTRILKQVAASRAAGEVLPNVFGSKETPKAVIEYKVGNKTAQDLTWESGTPHVKSELQRVRVFDTQTAAVQLSDSTQIAYMPTVLQILAEFTHFLQQVGELISNDIQELTLQEKKWPDLEIGIGVDLLQHLGSVEAKKTLLDLKPLTKQEKRDLESIPSKLQELATSDPAKLAVQARQRAGQLIALARNLKIISSGVSLDAVAKSQKLKTNLDAAKNTVDKARELVNDSNIDLSSTGNDLWKTMWNGAKAFVESDKVHIFPDKSDDSICPLCQQRLNDVARERFNRFSTFMNSEAQSEFEKATKLRELDISALKQLPFGAVQTNDIVDFVSTYDRALSSSLNSTIQEALTIKNDLVNEGSNDLKQHDTTALKKRFEKAIQALNNAAKAETDRSTDLSSLNTSAAAQVKLQQREETLKERQSLINAKNEISAQHDRVIRIAAFRRAERCCNTTSASKKNSDLSASYVKNVCGQFEREAEQLGISRVPVELVFDRSTHGVSYIKIQLKKAKNTPVNSVLSEGEQRIAAIAGFFADLTESGDLSTLVFDDPVSSLDQLYRVKVAQRLLQEAENRQVLVFTHDYSFVQSLYEEKELRDMQASSEGKQPAQDINYLHISRSSEGTGKTTTAEAWRQVSVKERLGRIKLRIQNSKPVYQGGDLVEYGTEARDIVGSIRETWEVFVEQELLNSVVTRHDRRVQTQRLSKLVDIQNSDIACVSLGMSIESRFMTGHAAPTGDVSAPLNPDELLNEEKRLEEFRKKVLDRRKGGGKNA